MSVQKLGTDTSVYHTSATVYNYSFQHTLVAGNRRAVFVCIGGETSNTGSIPSWVCTGVTYGGVAMTQLVQEATTETVNGQYNSNASVWVLKEASLPATGLKTIAVTGTVTAGMTVYLFGACAQFGNMDQTLAGVTAKVFLNQPAGTSTITNSIDTNNADVVVSSYDSGTSGTDWTVDQGQVEIYDSGSLEPQTTYGACYLLSAVPGVMNISSTTSVAPNRMVRVAAAFPAWRKTNATVAFSKINGVTRHNMGAINGTI